MAHLKVAVNCDILACCKTVLCLHSHPSVAGIMTTHCVAVIGGGSIGESARLASRHVIKLHMWLVLVVRISWRRRCTLLLAKRQN